MAAKKKKAKMTEVVETDVRVVEEKLVTEPAPEADELVEVDDGSAPTLYLPALPKLTKDSVLKCFPLDKPRDLQVYAIEKTVEAYVNGAQYVVLEAPVGTGKSPLGVAFARALGNRSYMLTLTEQLQEQYIDDFKQHGLVTLKGRAKFNCHTLGKGATCADGKHLKPRCTNCPYVAKKAEALAAPHVVANYHSFYSNVGKAIGNRDGEEEVIRPLLIADEAHTMEGFLLGEVSVTVRLNKLSVKVENPPNTTDDVEPYFDYITEELLPKLKAEKPIDPKAKEELTQLIGKLMLVLSTKDARWIPERGIIQGPGKVLDNSWFALKPLRVDRWGRDLWGKGHRQLFMSGTILDALQFCQSVGLDDQQGEHIELDSPFPAKNRPIYVGSLDMTKKARGTSWPIASQFIENILNEHKDEKGLLLCPSNEMLKEMQKKLSRVNQARLIFAAGENRKQQYQKHMTSRIPTVLCASGFWEGADLKGDACYDSETEILTEVGWVKFPELKKHTSVASYEPSDGSIKFEVPSHHTRTTKRNWVEYDTVTNNLMVTSEHRMLWKSTGKNRTIETFAPNPPAGHHYDFVVGGQLASGRGLPMSDDEIRLAVAFQADGHWVTNRNVARFGFKRAEKIERLLQLLKRLEANTSTQVNSREVTNIDVEKKAFINTFHLGDWYAGKEWKLHAFWQMTKAQRRVLLDELVWWDGSRAKRKKGPVAYHSTLPENLDAVQALAVTSNLRSNHRGSSVSWYPERRPTATFVKTDHNFIEKNYRIEMPAYCVTVSTGWVVTRRRGKVTVSGNSRFQIIPSLPRPMWHGQVAARAEAPGGNRWYLWMTLMKFLQGTGRSVRSEDDYAATYVFDAALRAELAKGSRSMIPGWVRKACHLVEEE